LILEHTIELLKLLYPDSRGLDLAKAAEFQGVGAALQREEGTWETLTGCQPISLARQKRAAYALKIAAFQSRVTHGFQETGIPYLSLKGMSLSKVLYGSVADRDFGDLDLLIPPERAEEALHTLEDLGFLRTYPRFSEPGRMKALIRYGKAQNLMDAKTGMSLDLHWKLVSPWIDHRPFPFEALWNQSRIIEIGGLPPWRTLGDEHTIIFLALHGYQDGWAKLKQLFDLAVALETLEVDWRSVLSMAGVRAPLVQRAAELVSWLLGVEQPEPPTRFFSSRERALKDWYAMATASKTPQSKLLRRALWSCSDAEWCLRSLRALTNPALDDIGSVNLPAALVQGYIGVRVARLLWKVLTRTVNPKNQI
jgi:hypothetical protein